MQYDGDLIGRVSHIAILSGLCGSYQQFDGALECRRMCHASKHPRGEQIAGIVQGSEEAAILQGQFAGKGLIPRHKRERTTPIAESRGQSGSDGAAVPITAIQWRYSRPKLQPFGSIRPQGPTAGARRAVISSAAPSPRKIVLLCV